MTQDLDPLRLRDRLRETLARYITTAVPVSATRAPGLARAVRQKLAEKSLELTKGPFLESLPDFGKKGSIRELVDSGVLADEWRVLQETGFEWLLDRPPPHASGACDPTGLEEPELHRGYRNGLGQNGVLPAAHSGSPAT